MNASAILFHHAAFQPLWCQPGLLQAGPAVADCSAGIAAPTLSARALKAALHRRGIDAGCVLLHYSDPFLLRSAPLRELRHWPGPKVLACGDLHHGHAPIETVAAYLQQEAHDAVLLTFNPTLVDAMRERITVPVRSLPPSFFRYPSAHRPDLPKLELLHVGSLGRHHPCRRQLVKALQARRRVPFRHATTATAEAAATLYAEHALVLNVPLNHDLNHRFFEVMAAGTPQVVVGTPALVGEHRHLADRPDVFWAATIRDVETLVRELFAEPERLRSIPVLPPPTWELQALLEVTLAP